MILYFNKYIEIYISLLLILINMDSQYFNKYLKYKNKYIKLKTQNAGKIANDETFSKYDIDRIGNENYELLKTSDIILYKIPIDINTRKIIMTDDKYTVLTDVGKTLLNIHDDAKYIKINTGSNLKKYFDVLKIIHDEGLDIYTNKMKIILQETTTNVILTEYTTNKLLFRDNIPINNIQMLKSCIAMFQCVINLYKKYQKELQYCGFDYEVTIDDNKIINFKFVPYCGYNFSFEYINILIKYIHDILRNLYPTKSSLNFFELLNDDTIDYELCILLKTLFDYDSIKIETKNKCVVNINELGCGKCSFTDYDKDKKFIPQDGCDGIHVLSYVLFAPKSHVSDKLQRELKEVFTLKDGIFTDEISKLLINSKFDINKYTKGLLNLGLFGCEIYKDWVIRLYYDMSLFNDDNKILYEPIFKWLNSKKNIQLIQFDFEDFKVNGGHDKLFGALLRIFPLFDETVSIIAFRDIDSIPSKKDFKILEDFIKSDKIIHVYDFDYSPNYIKCPLDLLKTKLKLDFINKYYFPLGLTAIKNIKQTNGLRLFGTENSKYIFDTLRKEDDFIDSFDIHKNTYLDDNEYLNVIKRNYINNKIPISLCVDTYRKTTDIRSVHFGLSNNMNYKRDYKDSINLWNFGSDEAIFNLLIYLQIHNISEHIMVTETFNIGDMYYEYILPYFRSLVKTGRITSDALTTLLLDFNSLNPKDSPYELAIILKYLQEDTITIPTTESNPHGIFIEELMPY